MRKNSVKKILVVDSDAQVASQLKIIESKLKFSAEFEVATETESALKYLESGKVDAIIIDINFSPC